MNTTLLDVEQKTINVLKGLIMDMVRNANSGHTGGPFSSLNFAFVLYKDFLKFDPKNPDLALLNLIDEEQIRLSGSKILYYKYFGAS